MKTPIQKLKSSKLFYNKWPYKVECSLRGASRVTRFKLDYLKKWCRGEVDIKFSRWEENRVDKKELLDFITVAEQFIGRTDVQIRTEGSHFNLFCKDQLVLEQIESSFFKWVKKISGPTTQEEYDFLMANGYKKILCDRLPKETFEYKVYIKTKWPADGRNNFLKWSDNYKHLIDLSPSSKKWLEGNKVYIQDPFMYVKDQKTLSMVGLFLGGFIRKVEHYIPRSEAFD